MTNDEIRKNTEIRMTNQAIASPSALRHSGLGFLSSLVIRHSTTCARALAPTLSEPRIPGSCRALPAVPTVFLSRVHHRARRPRHLRGVPEKTRPARGASALSVDRRADHRRMSGGRADCLVVLLHGRARPACDSGFVSRGNGLEKQIHGRTMSRRHLRRKGPGPLELIEEAVHFLR